ncbi:Uncharacterized conserved protein, DUF1015 family [Anaerocolumna jejuensis DSM 15929]|uniref:Uncharacterized conserved protein, DUF1015 family n=1 Tax=Anaerocolumna jejuensis DSM 15929 TaxID=1121322 RepID=A0A1M6WPM9_9FIRM|nr:DUF1015 family protein [Anaerocolumna jejuensis]SHK95641.1 Uncharacterized conserved protein, DUF1015 family [Anaerocolumna jejuensis DSM 15929]
MAEIKPFCSVRPAPELAGRIAALPYDVYNREEAKEEVVREPFSFLQIDRAETKLPDSVTAYDSAVYEKAKELLEEMITKEHFIREEKECFYLYELIMEGRSQTGLVACASIDDYTNGVIKRHENTRTDKELDRITHIDVCNAQTGPIFLTFRDSGSMKGIMEQQKKEEKLYGFTSPDGITHNVWKIEEKEIVAKIREEFEGISSIYIADGHHRAASAVKVGLKRREEHADNTGREEYNFFLSVIFPSEELMIMPYNRVVKGLNGYTGEEFLTRISECFEVVFQGGEPYQPKSKGEYGMYLQNGWYKLIIKEEYRKEDPVAGLDVSLLQDNLLGPVLGIEDPRTDKRIDFVGGIRGLGELERRVREDMTVAFSMYPTDIKELMAVSDQGKLMPPKSTWFEPKLRSGLFIHRI